MKPLVLAFGIFAASLCPPRVSAFDGEAQQVQYRSVEVQGLSIFYREAGPMDAPTILLLHGFPTSSHMFRNLIPALADKYHVVAPDYPGFGYSAAPDANQFDYTFDNLAKIVEEFTQKVGLENYSLYLSAAIQSPSSFNMQNWRFVVVRDKELKRELRAAAFDQAQVTDASLVIVLTADLNAWNRSPERYWTKAPREVAEMLVGWMGPFYEGKPILQRDEAMRSCGIAGQTIMLAAKAMGFDSCPMIGFDADQVANLIRLPGDHVISFIVVVGKGTQQPWPKPGQLDLSEVMIAYRFPVAHNNIAEEVVA